MDKEQDIVLTQDSLIELPESLLTAFTTAGGVLRCDNMQTTCPGCMGAPGQCSTCESCQCSTQSIQCGSCEDGCLLHECYQCGACQDESQGCGDCQTCLACQGGCLGVACQTCQCSRQSNQCGSCESGQNPTASGSITSYSTTSDSITIRYTSISKATSYEIVYRIDGQDTLYTAGTTSSLSFTITGLSPSTKYVVNYRGKNSYGYGAFMATGKTITTDRAFTPFDWTYAGLDPSTGTRVYGDTKQSGYGLLVTADEWNELVELVNAYYGSVVADFVRPGDTISAARVNPLAWKLGVGTVSSGTTTITADFFNRLRDAYNRLG